MLHFQFKSYKDLSLMNRILLTDLFHWEKNTTMNYWSCLNNYTKTTKSTSYGKISWLWEKKTLKINVRENRSGNQELIIQRNWQHRAHKTQDEDTQKTQTA
jgi:hypothetical protein